MLMLGLSLVGFYVSTGETEEEGADMDPVELGEEVVTSNCTSCHGENLEGASGPAIENVGAEMSNEEIADIAVNGVGSMPGGIASPEEAEAIAEYLTSIAE